MPMQTAPPRRKGPEADDVFAPLLGQVPDAELEALRIATVLKPVQRAVLTLISLGHTHRGAAVLLGGRRHAVQNALDGADEAMESGGRTPALLHAIYRHPGYPLPLPRSAAPEQPPVLDEEEHAVLAAYATGVTLIKLAESRRCPARDLTAVNKRLCDKLAARNMAHCVRRAWELAIYTRQNCPAAPADTPGAPDPSTDSASPSAAGLGHCSFGRDGRTFGPAMHAAGK
ncbi:hypothetical protein ABZ502_16915 [Streptomyces abikoensis]|uniref:hypothetical protein n=1 Tax=Streptomyces abikoensis TaxID=97398 RepID=UPI0033CCEC2D